MHYRCEWVPEYSREYLAGLDRPYRQDDILQIARGQLSREEKRFNAGGRFLFCDTEMLVCKIWSEEKFGHCHPWILEKLDRHRYDLYLLCNTDIPWQADPLRENPHDRDRLFGLYLKELTAREFPFAVISGTGKQRIDNAIRIIDRHFRFGQEK